MAFAGKLIILTGEIGSGKSTLCRKISEKLQKSGGIVKGVICPPTYEGEIKTGIEIVSLSDGSHHQLARLREPSSTGLLTHRWDFDEQVTAWGNQVIGDSIPCDVLIIDELGPLEFDHGTGFTNGFSALDSRRYQLALVVIRPSLVDKARLRWPDAKLTTVTAESRDGLPGKIVSLFC
jgi:nucleoside-triphosphatase THEP1